MDRFIYKIATREQWQAAQEIGRFDGAPVDLADGYIHFSTAAQMRDTAALYFSGQHDLLLVEVAVDRLGQDLKYEPSRGGQLFPHLYGRMDLSAVTRTWKLPLDDQGLHVFPEGLSA